MPLNSADYWTKKIHQEIPMTRLAGIRISELTHQSIKTIAPIEPNSNGHQTGFAGSIYMLGITTAWTLISSLLKDHNIPTLVVAQQASINYLKPLKHELFAACHFEDGHPIEKWQLQWNESLSVRQELKVKIGYHHHICAEMSALYYIRKKHQN